MKMVPLQWASFYTVQQEWLKANFVNTDSFEQYTELFVYTKQFRILSVAITERKVPELCL